MAQKKGKRLYSILFVIGILMLANIYLIFQNSKQINKQQQVIITAEKVKQSVEEVIQAMHLLDLGIRAYALLGNRAMYNSPWENSTKSKNQAFAFLKKELNTQGYPLEGLFSLKESVDGYFEFIDSVSYYIDNDDSIKARKMIAEDRGYPIWIMAEGFLTKVNEFESRIELNARKEFEFAVRSSYWLQVILFFITMPTLAYSVFYSVKSISLAHQLRIAEKEKADILEQQNEKLEMLVRERTDEILAQNEEIKAQNEEISEQNDHLVTAKSIIEDQQKKLQFRNEELSSEIVKQNEELMMTNSELITQNNKLEQFAYIISHNLRAPIARLLGLGNLLKQPIDQNEKERVVDMMVTSSKDLNEIISDMGQVLMVQNPGSKTVEIINLDTMMEKVRKSLGHEILDNQAEIITDFSAVNKLNSIPLYVENIFYNLLSNAIKYKHPQRIPHIHVKSEKVADNVLIEVKDNGLGINLERDREKLFGLYMRFYFHVEGKGLGLYLVRKQLETLGGSIDVSSVKNEGTTFFIRFKG